MTGRELLLNLLHGGERDRLTWTTIIDARARSSLPEGLRETSPLELCRMMGCDIMQFGNMGLDADERFTPLCHWTSPELEVRSERLPDGSVRTVRETTWGALTAVSRDGHPITQPVTTPEAMRILTRLWESAGYEETPGAEASYAPLQARIGESGILAQTVSASPVQWLLQLEMGMEGFYYLLQDHPRELERLLEAMHARKLEEYEIVARRTPADVVIPVENTSSTLTSPAIYERYGMPPVRDYVRIIHAHGKTAILHMCGCLRDLLGLIARTELDGINGLTPPPVGDTRHEEALDALGEDLVILGGVFPPEVFYRTSLTADEVSGTLDAIYTPRLCSARFLLWIPVDGLRVDPDRFELLRRWFHANGALP